MTRANSTLQAMINRDPVAPRGLLDASAGYVVFPDIGKAGAIVGGAYGRGIQYEHGRAMGYVDLKQASFGAQLGAQSFTELIVFHDAYALQRLKTGQFDLGANASAVALTSGVAATAQFREGVAVFTLPRGGVMAEMAVSGQKLDYRPMGG